METLEMCALVYGSVALALIERGRDIEHLCRLVSSLDPVLPPLLVPIICQRNTLVCSF